MTTGLIVVVVVAFLGAFAGAAALALALEWRDGRAWNNGPGAEETRRYTQPVDDPDGRACEHTLHSNDDLRQWTAKFWNDMNSKETNS